MPVPQSQQRVPTTEPFVMRLTLVSIAGSFLLAVGLVAVHILFDSQLALAQAADSISDMFAGVALAWAVRQASQPADEDHPLGHGRAEPLAALVVAVLAGVLAVEVLRGGVMAVVEGAVPQLDWPLAFVFAAKVVFKIVIVGFAIRQLKRQHNPALDALRVDARNDVLVSCVALLGLGLAYAGLPAVDSWLSIAIGIYVGFSGLGLARENVGLLMGEAAPADRHEELVRIAGSITGVRGVDDLIATWSGTMLLLQVEIAVDPELSVHDAHDIAHLVEERLLEEEDVSQVVVHVGPAV